MKLKIKPILLILFFFIIYVYICNITLLPKNIIIFQGEELNLKTIYGLKVNQKKSNISNYEVMQTSTNLSEKVGDNIGTINLSLDLFGTIPLKEIDVNVLPRTKVIPLGNSIGLKLYTNGVLVVGMGEIEDENNIVNRPYEKADIQEGDTILEVNEQEIENISSLKKIINSSNGENLELKILREGSIITSNILPVKTGKEEYKLGLWVKDAATGVGTISFYEPKTNSFAVLGHGITDSDTGNLINIDYGELVTSKILSIKKGESGEPGEVRGTIINQQTIGEVSKNTDFGVYGNLENLTSLNIDVSKAIKVASRDEIEIGEAKILCATDSSNTVKEYSIEIEKIYLENNSNNKSMLIKIKDEELLAKTGGIIRGLSGAPIIQNGKFIGAVTNVLVSNPEIGYAIFGDLMLKEIRK